MKEIEGRGRRQRRLRRSIDNSSRKNLSLKRVKKKRVKIAMSRKDLRKNNLFMLTSFLTLRREEKAQKKHIKLTHFIINFLITSLKFL